MWISWALLDLRSGELMESSNSAETTMTASMVKAWIVADYLTRFGMHENLSTIIRDSANEPAWQIYGALGREDSIHRMIETCELTDSSPGEDLSMTLMSARDTVRLGARIADGTAAGPWTQWLLTEMRAVAGRGDFGIRDAFRAADRGEENVASAAARGRFGTDDIAIKNGWDKRVALGVWNVNCLAIAQTWVMAALARYPDDLPLEAGAQACRDLASELRELGAFGV